MDHFENDIKELEKLEDHDIKRKEKVKRQHDIKKDDHFYRVKLRFNNYSRIYKSKIKDIRRGAFVIVPTQYGNELAYAQGKTSDMDDILSQEEILELIRIANKKDIAKFKDNLQKEKKAFRITIDTIAKHKLEMKLINVHYFLEDSKVLFNFTADGRVDFRELVKDLASIFKTRIELRQIGVRDECRIMNGFGQCGKHLCCANVINDLNPITIKMAKEQNITLNSLKISGVCGRLLCCLAYEYDTYVKEKKSYPPEGARIRIENDWYTIIEINIQTKQLKIISEKEKGLFMYINMNEVDFDYKRNTGIMREKK